MDESTRPLPVQSPPARPVPGLTARTVLVTCVVALVSVVVTAVIALPLATHATLEQTRRSLADRTDLVASYLAARQNPRARRVVVEELRDRGVPVVLIVRGSAYPDRLPDRIVTAVATDQRPVSTTLRRGGRTVLVEGRPLGARNGVVLTEQLDTTVNRQAVRRLVLALLVGLLAGVAAGVVLARRLSLPLRRAAYAARRMSAGDRNVVLPVEPPAEVADLGRALNELNAALATSEDRQRRFLMSVSHELRTPLTTIRGYAEALADGVLTPGVQAGPHAEAGTGAAAGPEAGRTMLAEAARLDRLVSDLLALARLQAQDFPVEMVGVDLVTVVTEAATAWRPRCAEVGVELRPELSVTPVPAYTDPGRLRQVLDGLVENALRLVPAGGPIVLAVRAEPHTAVAEVRDGGPGLTDQDLAVAFEQGALHERYRRVRQVGSGLGLALAHGLVHRLGGRIEAGHASEGGARFTVRLPPAPR
jgi:two-component system sensor histidine kinase BaeS